MREHWGSERMVGGGRVFYPAEHPGFIAESGGRAAGVASYEIKDGECEVTSINSLREGRGIGGELLGAVVRQARAHGCRRVWLITTNDNLNALKFYQKRGFRLVAVYPGAMDKARVHKPEIPLVAENGVPIRDELELELILDDAGGTTDDSLRSPGSPSSAVYRPSSPS